MSSGSRATPLPDSRKALCDGGGYRVPTGTLTAATPRRHIHHRSHSWWTDKRGPVTEPGRNTCAATATLSRDIRLKLACPTSTLGRCGEINPAPPWPSLFDLIHVKRTP